jgi:23S rRNA (adenine2503-C2)-methyltransferase
MPVVIKPGLEFLEKVRSMVDNTVKYIFLAQNQIVEFSYINKGDGKDIICAPTQTGCNLKCKFCFLSDYDLVVRNLTPDEIESCIKFVVDDLNLLIVPEKNDVLLISYMGCGEPLLNTSEVVEASRRVMRRYHEKYKVVRFAVASLIPRMDAMLHFIQIVKSVGIPLKFHLSLHFTEDELRKKMMPGAMPLAESVAAVELFMHYTGNSAEIHYALIEGVNDRAEDILALIRLLKHRSIPVKFLAYNEKPSLDYRQSQKIAYFRSVLEAEGIKTEFYLPPGSDIGSSCGQFLMDYYEKYNTKKKK